MKMPRRQLYRGARSHGEVNPPLSEQRAPPYAWPDASSWRGHACYELRGPSYAPPSNAARQTTAPSGPKQQSQRRSVCASCETLPSNGGCYHHRPARPVKHTPIRVSQENSRHMGVSEPSQPERPAIEKSECRVARPAKQPRAPPGPGLVPAVDVDELIASSRARRRATNHRLPIERTARPDRDTSSRD